MFDLVVRFAKRFAVLIPGIVIAYLSVTDIFPIFEKHVPDALAIFLTYVLGAYVLIPAAIRLLRILFPVRHAPLYCVTPDGFASDPLNVGIIGSRAELIKAMQAAGWYVADEHTVPHLLQVLISGLLRRPYPTAPMSNLYLFGRKQDIGFEIPIDSNRGHRHHVRFWATTFKDDGPISPDRIRWHIRKSQRTGSNLLWLGAASRDIGFAFIRHNVQVTHMIHPDTGRERELIISGLRSAHKLARTETIRLGKPYRLRNRALGGHLRSDGMLQIARLKKD